MHLVSPPKSPDTIFDKLHEEAQILTNIGFIIDKMHKDNFLPAMQVLFDQIMSHEISFTIGGKPDQSCSESRATSRKPT